MSHLNEAELSDEEARLAGLFGDAKKIVFFSGAGISTESGIADFRSPGGIWSRIKPIDFRDFVSDEAVRLEDWRRRFHFQAEFDAAQPNQGHRTVAQFMASDRGLGVITQNIDGLHQRAGVSEADLIEIHGNGTKASCLDCKSPMPLTTARNLIEETGLAPRCQRCDGLVKADVVSFGQPMPQGKMAQAQALTLQCDLFVVLGSSLVVQPAASFPSIARNNGAALAIINAEPTPLDSVANCVLHAPIGETLRRIVENSKSGLHDIHK